MENYYIQIANEHKISVEKLEATMGQVIAYLYVHRHKTIRVLSIRIEKKVNYFYEVTTSD